MIRLSLRNFMKLYRFHRLFAVLSTLCLIFSMLSFIVLTEKAVYIYNDERAQEYLFAESDDPNTILSIYEAISIDGKLPPLVSISLFNREITGIDFYGDDFDLYIPYGRIFSAEEMLQGSSVALLSLEYVRQLPQDKIDQIWENGLSIESYHFDAVGGISDIGRYFSPSELGTSYPIPTLVGIPLKTFLQLGLQPTMINCRFSQFLTEDQTHRLETIMQSQLGLRSFHIPGMDKRIDSTLAETLSAYSLLLLISLIATSTIVLSLYEDERRRYTIYLMLGAKKMTVYSLMIMNLIMLHLTAYGLALVLMAIINSAFESIFLASLPAVWHIWIALGMVSFSCIIITMRTLPLLLRNRKFDRNKVVTG